MNEIKTAQWVETRTIRFVKKEAGAIPIQNWMMSAVRVGVHLSC